MVGVPGRSKACITCLKRKKRCDLQKPFCGTCRKSCRECEGYSRPRIFINNTVLNPDTKWTVRATAAGASQNDRANIMHPDDERGGDGESVALLPTLARSARQAKYLELFWNMYLPNSQALSSKVTQNVVGGWLDAIQTLHTTDDPLRKSILAMSMVSIGSYGGDRALREEGMRVYASSLQSIAVALKYPRRLTQDGLLTAVRLCSLYESMHGSDDRNPRTQARSWLVHNTGDIALMMARGPYSFINGHAHGLFVDGRAHLTFAAIGIRKRIFLSEPAWRTIPWTVHKKSPRDHLIDILTDIPSFFEGVDLMKATPNPEAREMAREQLIPLCLQLKKRLLQWHSVYATGFELGDELPGIVPSETLASAYLMAIYWATSILVCCNLRSLTRQFEFADSQMDLDLFCQKVLRAILFFFYPAMGLFRVHLVNYPFTVVFGYIRLAELNRLATERQLLAACLEHPAGAGIRRFISSQSVVFSDFLG